jgi:hypothetical protein
LLSLCVLVTKWLWHTHTKKNRGKTPEEIRQTFNIKNDFTPEEEEQMRKETEWCMDL